MSRAAGARGEDLAAEWLEAKGWSILVRNLRSRWGEIDIVATRGQDLAFVEVKSWNVLGKDSLEQSVGAVKQRRIRMTAEWYLARRGDLGALRPRFDVLFVRGGAVSAADHIEGAF